MFGAEFDRDLTRSKDMSLHGVDHGLAFCLGGVETQFRVERKDLEMIRMGAPAIRGEIWSSPADLTIGVPAEDTGIFAPLDRAGRILDVDVFGNPRRQAGRGCRDV